MTSERFNFYTPSRQDYLDKFTLDGYRDKQLMEREQSRRKLIITEGLKSGINCSGLRAYLSLLGSLKARGETSGYKVLELLTLKLVGYMDIGEEEAMDAIQYGVEFEWLSDYVGRPVNISEYYGLLRI